MLLLGGIIIEIAIASTFLAYYFNNINFGARLSSEALEAARGGIDDALVRAINNKFCPDATCPGSYQVTVASGRTANVTMVHPGASQPCGADPNNPATTQLEITSVGGTVNRNRTMRAVATVSCLSGEVTVNSINEI